MKKVLTLILAIFVLASAFCVVPASAVSQDNIEITTNVSKIIVKVSAPADGTMTAQLVNTQNNILYGMDEENTPAQVNGEYVYTFNFKMQYNVPTATYKVIVGGNVAQTEKEFPYVNINDKISFYTNLDTTAVDGICQYFIDNPSFVPVDLTEYYDLSDGVKYLVNQKIDALDLNPDILITDADPQKNLKVTAKDSLFQSSFATFMDVAKIADADEANLQEAIDNATFSNYFYSEATAGSAALNASEVLGAYKSEAQKVTSLELSNYVKAFNDATILTIEKTKDYGTLKNAFLYYEENSLLTPAPDMTNIDALVLTGKDTDLWKDLLRAENVDVATMVANAESIAQTMVDNGIITQTPVSPGVGGGGAGGGGGGSVDKPTTPGASAGIVEKQEETVQEVKTFKDLKDAEWAREAVESLAAKGAINGKTQAEFAPNDSMKREEFIKVLIGAFDLLNDAAECEFSDVSKERWSYSYIASAKRIGLVSGDGENFNPLSTISRQDMAVIIYRLFELAGVKVSDKNVTFSDEANISAYAKEAVATLSGAGVINGMGDGTFSPKTSVTRAQAAKVIYELGKIIGGEN